MICRVIVALTIIVYLVITMTCPVATAAGDGTYSVREYPLPGQSGDIGAMAVDESGNVWLLQNSPAVLYKLVNENRTFSNYTLENFGKASFAGMSVDEQGNVWFADLGGNRFGAYTEATNETAHFSFPGPMAPTSVLRRGDIVWLGCKEEVGEYDLRFPDEPFIDHFVYHMDSYLYDIHFDRFDNVWAVENAKNNVSVYWRMYDKTSEFAIPTENSYPTCLSIDNKGRLWFVESAPDKLGMFHTEIFNFTEYDVPLIDGTRPVISRVATVGDMVWLTDVKNGRVLRYLPDQGKWAAAVLGEGTLPVFIEPDGNGTLWIYESGSRKLASLDVTDQFGQATPTPVSTATPVPTPLPTPLPTRTPGFLSLLAIAALATALYIMAVKKD